MSDKRPKILVTIASYGTKNIDLLREIIAAYRSMSFEIDIIVVSDAPKDLGIETDVVVGCPTNNPWSLPFAHKKVLADNIGFYDFFVYSEDDMEVTEGNILAFLGVSSKLQDDEIAGYLRYEVDAAGGLSLPEVHGNHHWMPESVAQRADLTIARFSSDHAAFYILSQSQLRRAIASGGFLREPYEDRYDMLCTAATDPYTVCGFRKVICISLLEDFLIHHKSNRYAGAWGISLSEFKAQVRTLMEISSKRHPASTLCNSETRMLHGEWSKSYYEQPDENVLQLIPRDAKSILSIGCGWGALEAKLQGRGAKVTAVPLDSVIGAIAGPRGLDVVYGSLDEGFDVLRDQAFDCVIMTNLLHLLPDPERAVSQWSRLVSKGGTFVISGPNFGSLRVKAKHLLGKSGYRKLSSFEAGGIRVLGPRTMKKVLKGVGLNSTTVRWLGGGVNSLESRLGPLGSPQWVLRAKN